MRTNLFTDIESSSDITAWTFQIDINGKWISKGSDYSTKLFIVTGLDLANDINSPQSGIKVAQRRVVSMSFGSYICKIVGRDVCRIGSTHHYQHRASQQHRFHNHHLATPVLLGRTPAGLADIGPT